MYTIEQLTKFAASYTDYGLLTVLDEIYFHCGVDALTQQDLRAIVYEKELQQRYPLANDLSGIELFSYIKLLS